MGTKVEQRHGVAFLVAACGGAVLAERLAAKAWGRLRMNRGSADGKHEEGDGGS